jgi:hypothetical protein
MVFVRHSSAGTQDDDLSHVNDPFLLLPASKPIGFQQTARQAFNSVSFVTQHTARHSKMIPDQNISIVA